LEYYVYNRDKILDETKKAFNIESRDVVKNLYSRLMYGSSPSYWKKDNKIDEEIKYEFADKYYAELQNLMNIITENNEDIKTLIYNSKKTQGKKDYEMNLKGATLSYYLQNIECQILEQIYLYCTEKKYIKNNDCVLCADGVMIPRKNYKPELLSELRTLIISKFGLFLNFTQKEMKEHYLEILDDSQKKVSLLENEFSYEQLKKEFEKSHFKMSNPISYCVEKDLNVIIKSKKDFKDTYENLFYYIITVGDDGKEKKTKHSFIDDWMKDPQIRTYSKFTFNPRPNLDIDNEEYNSFRGFKYDTNNEEPYNEELIKPFKKLIKHIFQDDYDHFINWFAWIRQKPHIKTDIAIIMYSHIHGIGKNAVISLIEKIFSKYTTKISNIDDLTKNFNANFAEKFIIYGDEINRISPAGKTYRSEWKCIHCGKIKYKSYLNKIG
jgi:hypothetical protein